MKLVHVIPLSKSSQKETLTYFTVRPVKPGMIVSVPLRRKVADALVVGTEDLMSFKTGVKTAAFNFRKILEVKGEAPFSKAFFSAVADAKNYFAAGSGAIVSALVPKLFLESPDLLPVKTPDGQARPPEADTPPRDKLAIQIPLADRLTEYKTIIRESFARKKSVFICFPTAHELEIAKRELERGIEPYAFSLHGHLSKKSLLKSAGLALAEPHPVAIFATGHYFFLPRADIGTIILEHESSGAYRAPGRPYMHLRAFAEIFSYHARAKYIVGDSLLSTETIWRTEKNELGELSPLSFRLTDSVTTDTLSMKKDTDSPNSPKDLPLGIPKGKSFGNSEPFSIFHPDAIRAIKDTLAAGKRIFLFTLRKGLATATVCNDCGDTLLCDACEHPLVLYEKAGGDTENPERIFVCGKCGRETPAKIVCKNCGGWNLSALGIGTDTVAKEARRLFPEAPVFQLDQNTATTERKAHGIIKSFEASKSGILVGTERALVSINEKPDLSVVVSFDSLFALPTFRIGERILELLLAIRARTGARLLIQTRRPDLPMLRAIENKNLLPAYKAEIRGREEFNYPPFSMLIKISHLGTPLKSAASRVMIEERFAPWNPEIFRAFTPKIRNLYATHAVLRLPRTSWSLPALIPGTAIDTELLARLRALPPEFAVRVEPENLL